MKIAFVIAGLAWFSASASAQGLHRHEVVHNGRAVTFNYEPNIETDFQQLGVGPRLAASCRWKTRILVQRNAVDTSGAPIPVLTRTIDTGRSSKGSRTGYCPRSPQAGTAEFGSDPAALQTLIVEVAASDREALQKELASLDMLTGSGAGAK